MNLKWAEHHSWTHLGSGLPTPFLMACSCFISVMPSVQAYRFGSHSITLLWSFLHRTYDSTGQPYILGTFLLSPCTAKQEKVTCYPQAQRPAHWSLILNWPRLGSEIPFPLVDGRNLSVKRRSLTYPNAFDWWVLYYHVTGEISFGVLNKMKLLLFVK